MPTVRIPLVGSFNQRGIAGNAALVLNEDQRFLNCAFDVVQNPVTQKAVVYVEKRQGWAIDTLVEAGSVSTGLIKPQAFNATLSAFGANNSTVYVGSISVGAITGLALHFTETLISNVAYVMIKSSDGTGWYYVDGAKDQTAYTGDTHTNTTIDGIASTAGMYSGQVIAGTNIVAGTRILSVDSANAITTDTATTGTATVAITKTPIAKILDAQFVTTGTSISAFSEMDGYLFYTNTDGYIRNSDLNSVISYTAANQLAVQMSPDPPVAVARHKNNIIVLGGASKEVFYNAGLASGSPLQRQPQFFDRIGCLNQRSVTVLENEIFFVATPYEGDIGVYRIRELQAQRISTPHVDTIMGTISASGGAIYASSFRMGGYPYAAFFCSLASDVDTDSLLLESGDIILLESADYILLEGGSVQTASYVRTMVYNATLNIWSEWDASEATFIDSVGSGTSNQVIATSRSETGGYVYTINPVANGDVYRDAGAAYSLEIRTARIDHGSGKKKYIEEIKLIGDRQSAGTATLECNDDDYESSSWVTLGTFDLTSMDPRITRCGAYHGGRAYRLTHSYNGPFRAEALEITYRTGIS